MKLPSQWMSALDWKSLWIFIVVDIVWILLTLFFFSMGVSFGQTRLQLRFVFRDIYSLFHFESCYWKWLWIFTDCLDITRVAFLFNGRFIQAKCVWCSLFHFKITQSILVMGQSRFHL
jgi:hypothetical protein